MHVKLEQSNESRTKRKTRENLLNTAFSLFSSQGFDITTFVEIANTAKVTRRTLYNYYDTKEDVILDLHKYVLEDIINSWNQINLTYNNFQEDLNQYIIQAYRLLKEESQLINYLVYFDQYSHTQDFLSKPEYMLLDFIYSNSQIYSILEGAIQKKVLKSEYSDADLLARILIQTIIAYFERIEFRRPAHEQENVLLFEDFEIFISDFTSTLFI